MAIGLRLEDKLEKTSNFIPWKSRIVLIMHKKKLWDEVVNNTQVKLVHIPATTYVATSEAFNKKDINVKRIILDVVKDHVIPHVTGRNRTYQMWNSLTDMYRNSNENRKIILRETLKGIKMEKYENVTSYLTRIT